VIIINSSKNTSSTSSHARHYHQNIIVINIGPSLWSTVNRQHHQSVMIIYIIGYSSSQSSTSLLSLMVPSSLVNHPHQCYYQSEIPDLSTGHHYPCGWVVAFYGWGIRIEATVYPCVIVKGDLWVLITRVSLPPAGEVVLIPAVCKTNQPTNKQGVRFW
jgi:hypothetical protein